VTIRIITEKPVQEALTASNVFAPTLAAKLTYIKFNFVTNSPLTEMTIFDKKTVFISIQQENCIKKMIWFYSNNAFIVEVANNYFENLWMTSSAKHKTTYCETIA